MERPGLKKILLIDDEKPIAETIEAYAKKENLELVYARDGEAGLDLMAKEKFEVILLDWMLPGVSGLEMIKIIREKSDVPILMISARNDEGDIVLGLEMGADDYITKPFSPRELMARIHSLLRRNQKAVRPVNVVQEDVILGNVEISFGRKEVLKNGKIVEMTSAEFRILEDLYANQGKVVSREDLMTRALGYRDFMNDRTLDTHIKNIRKKLEDDPKNPELIKTVREAGFKLVIAPL